MSIGGEQKRTHMELGCRVTWAWILSLANVGVSVGLGPELGGPLVASQLGNGGTTGGEVKELSIGRGIVQVSVLMVGRMIGT